MKWFTALLFLLCSATAFASEIPDSFVEIREVIPEILMDIHYATEHNFLGAKVNGYEAAKCYLTHKAMPLPDTYFDFVVKQKQGEWVWDNSEDDAYSQL
ncbi:hypothetical protein LZ24_01730 [Desulfobotulus alkaliphilus]|uniref:Uncharacterized protein n=1 Tax=Desulfobotulus alkaliphilus TaxID=622671 RepID=A0A562RTD6_9BACT|nr:hypothetical protein [Desulfobotulus alkaliphilus]TWI72322.1 hypothetical protein LZ24_01730 [Desulfobotulus alkaliphilus]